MNKPLILKRFTKSLGTYDENAIIQRSMSKKLLSLCDRTDFEKILEIGCGTGMLTKLAAKNLSYRNYIANDIVPECGSYISNFAKNVRFVCADIEKIGNSGENTYDLIISNAAFQWTESSANFFNKLISRLNPNGILLFSTFGPENFCEISAITGKTLNYESAEYYNNIFAKWQHYVTEEIQLLSFKSPIDVLKHLKATGVNAISSEIWTKSTLQNFENKYREICPAKITLTYNPMYVRVKNGGTCL